MVFVVVHHIQIVPDQRQRHPVLHVQVCAECDKLQLVLQKLHLVEKFLNIRSQVMKIHELADKYHAEDIAAISNVILEEL